MYACTCCLEFKGSRKASNKGEKTKDGDEKKLEAVGIKTKGEFVSNNVTTNGGGVNLTLGRSGEEGWDSLTLVALNDGETIINDVGLLGKTTGGGSSSVKGRVTGDLELWVGQVSRCDLVDWCLVSSSGDSGERLPGLSGGSESWVSINLIDL
jgi:hypothetical protein